jgi:hypothetical protein
MYVRGYFWNRCWKIIYNVFELFHVWFFSLCDIIKRSEDSWGIVTLSCRGISTIEDLTISETPGKNNCLYKLEWRSISKTDVASKRNKNVIKLLISNLVHTTHVIHCIITNFTCLSGNKFTNWCPSSRWVFKITFRLPWWKNIENLACIFVKNNLEM